MKRSVGVPGVVVTLVGFVIGISIFVLPGELGATAGPGVVLSYGIAGVMALFSCFVAAQIGAVFPASGASFIAVSRLVSPFWGFSAIWLLIGGAAVAVALVAYGFADYARLLSRAADRTAVAALVVVALAALNLLGTRKTVIGQGILVAVFMIALAVFCVAGLLKLDPELLAPFLPNGLEPVLAAAVPAFFSFAGFMVVIDIGGEIRDPSRTIPIGLAVSFSIVLVVYMAVSLSIVGIIPWKELAGMAAPVGEAAARVLPNWMTLWITLAVLAAAATSINAILLGYSRDVLALAQVKVLPEAFARISPRHGEPSRGVLLITALSLLAIVGGGTLAEYATLVVIALLVLQAALGVAALRIPTRCPTLYREAGFRLGPVGLPFCGVGLIILSAVFLAIAARQNLRVLLIAAVWLLLGVVYYAIRRSALARRSLDLEDLVRCQVEAAIDSRSAEPNPATEMPVPARG